MDEQERAEKQLTDFDDPDRGADDERVESGEEAIDESGRNPTQRRIDEGGEAPVDVEPPAS
ncbi:MAG: hypothetical protein H0X21_04695 [Actinobacteria bacterium]|nr:hypothetical protein [Actinomycetota bacterium]